MHEDKENILLSVLTDGLNYLEIWKNKETGSITLRLFGGDETFKDIEFERDEIELLISKLKL